MKKLFNILIIALSSFMAFGQDVFVQSINGPIKRQKKYVNKNCVSYEKQNYVFTGLNYLVDEEPKQVSEKNFENYILSKYPYAFSKTTVRYCVVFQPNIPPCYRQIDIEDSLKTEPKQLDSLTKLVLKYPAFSKIQFEKDEKIKYLVIYMHQFKKNPFSVSFTTDWFDKDIRVKNNSD